MRAMARQCCLAGEVTVGVGRSGVALASGHASQTQWYICLQQWPQAGRKAPCLCACRSMAHFTFTVADSLVCCRALWKPFCVLLVSEIQQADDGERSSVTAVGQSQSVYSRCTYLRGAHGSAERHRATDPAGA